MREKIAAMFRDDDVFWNNEIRANVFTCIQLYILTGVLFLSYILASVGVFNVPMNQMNMAILVNVPLMLIAAILCNVYKGQKHWIKYVLCMVCEFISIALCSTLNIFVTLVIAIPVILSVRYYSKRLTVTMSIVSVIGMAISEIIFGYNGILNLNLVSVPESSVIVVGEEGLRTAVLNNGFDFSLYMSGLFRGSFLPRLLMFSIIAITCIELASKARDMVLEQVKVSEKTEGLKAELSMATKIQTGVLPKDFSIYSKREDFDLFASMKPAKEVGGDFYDCYMIDEDHIALVIADVSGKGVPAALFMMVSKLLIKNNAINKKSPKEIAELVNNQLCYDNSAEMFVTAWIGIVELSTGKVTAVDAGHEYPAIYKKSIGKFELLKGKKCLILGGLEGAKYREFEFTLDRGDMLFLYTDGVAEATDKDEQLFGTDRMLEVLNRGADSKPKDLILDIIDAVDDFVEDAPQFDDITMLAFKFK